MPAANAGQQLPNTFGNHQRQKSQPGKLATSPNMLLLKQESSSGQQAHDGRFTNASEDKKPLEKLQSELSS